MPNRIIKESLCTSEKIASLSDFEFRLWVGLITQVDDAGRGDARPAIIKGRVFPFRERLANKDIENSLQALAAKGCVSLYTVGGKPYFLFPGWANHQRIRDCKPKFPGIEESDNSPQVAADCGLNPIQSNPNPNPNPNPNTSNCGESVPDSPKKTQKTYRKPTVQDVQVYCQENGYSVDPERFCDYYESNGWKVGKNPMKDWKAAVRTWAKNQSNSRPAQKSRRGDGDELLDMINSGVFDE